MTDEQILDGMAAVLLDLEHRMTDLQAELSPVGSETIAPRQALQQLDYVTQALGDLMRLCAASQEADPWANAISDIAVVKLERIRNGLHQNQVENEAAEMAGGSLTLF